MDEVRDSMAWAPKPEQRFFMTGGKLPMEVDSGPTWGRKFLKQPPLTKLGLVAVRTALLLHAREHKMPLDFYPLWDGRSEKERLPERLAFIAAMGLANQRMTEKIRAYLDGVTVRPRT